METKSSELLPDYNSIKTVYISINCLFPRNDQPRINFPIDKIQELATSIKNFGIIQPIVVKSKNDFEYWIISGERRWRAASLVGLEKVPCIITQSTEEHTNEVALIENIQRENLNPIEEALALEKLLKKSGTTLEKLSEKIGKKRSSISNSLRLLTLPKDVQSDLQSGALTLGHAKALCALQDIVYIQRIRKLILTKGLSVRQTENLVQKAKRIKENLSDEDLVSNEIRQLCDQLKGHLGTKVKISGTPQNGKIEVCYFSMEDLERVTDLILGQSTLRKITKEECSRV